VINDFLRGVTGLVSKAVKYHPVFFVVGCILSAFAVVMAVVFVTGGAKKDKDD
jgi:hypothetical protein